MSKKDEAGQQFLEILKRFKSSFFNTVIIIMVVMINTHVICKYILLSKLHRAISTCWQEPISN